jgi:ribonuclease P protein component
VRGERYLTKAAQYGLVYKEGRSWSGPALVVKSLPNGLGLSRYGFSVSRRIGNAVIRNRVKRRLREIMRHAALKPGADIIFIARPPAAGVTYQELDRAAKTLLKRAGIVVEENETTCTGTN